MPQTTIEEDDSPIGVMCTDVFGAGWGSFRIAHLSTGDRIGVEIFEFNNAEKPEDNFEYWKTGVFHFCVQDRTWKALQRKSLRQAVNSACQFVNTSPAKSLPHGLHGRSVRKHSRDLQPQLRADLLRRRLRVIRYSVGNDPPTFR